MERSFMPINEIKTAKPSTALRSSFKNVESSTSCADINIRKPMAKLRNGLTCTEYIGKGFRPLKSLLSGTTTGLMEALI